MRSAAFDAWPEAALVIDSGGTVRAVNEAAEELFGQWLGMLTRNPLQKVLPADSALITLVQRCSNTQSAVRVRDIEVALFAQAPLTADAAATPLPEGVCC